MFALFHNWYYSISRYKELIIKLNFIAMAFDIWSLQWYTARKNLLMRFGEIF